MAEVKEKIKEKKKRKPRDSWDKAEIEYFLNLIKEKQIIAMLDGKKFKVKDVFKKLEEPMEKAGYKKDAEQMINKLKLLKRKQYLIFKIKISIIFDFLIFNLIIF